MKMHKVEFSQPRSVKNVLTLKRVESNYSNSIDSLAVVFNLSSSYLKALIALESSGRLNIKPRFEKHVFKELKNVRDRKQKNYGSITYETIHDASDEALKNLATSWGPFQLMGYLCIRLGVNVNDIRGENSLYWGVYWINKRYGEYIRKGQYEDAFHIHNTGRPLPLNGKPLTHRSTYLKDGVAYMDFFEGLQAKQIE